MSKQEFTNINGIYVCDEAARNKIPTKTSQLTNDTEYITKKIGNASQIIFADGKTFQAKLDDGSLKGERGEIGPQGLQGPQ